MLVYFRMLYGTNYSYCMVARASRQILALRDVNLFFEANEIAAAKRVAVFLSAIGGGTYYSLLRNLQAPTLPKDKTLGRIDETLRAEDLGDCRALPVPPS